ncbi:antitoxin VbhA family protein [Alkaliphilus peptidifermentans]|uniref:Antitoxin VbhA domain-containing protein n=1 Tax=Alkaliphilus peptidifermentans DSM 18978 TaxID=1120976 RepID=A0A1G5E705_9FIRM|nr:antitoxin VbhA family protein [Alkaliphilus peptidifermentans]SCY22803.1 hypothetical protein SAMN03080606_01071 [Alkaliphilus peptidifermentans DSM 18978]
MCKVSVREMEKRIREVDYAMSINDMNNIELTQKDLELFESYIDGKISLKQVRMTFKKRSG